MIPYQQANELILAALPSPVVSRLPIDQSVGHVLATDIVSDIDVAPFRNSRMDGFAVRSALLAHCTANNPVTLSVSETLFAGSTPSGPVNADAAIKVMTGAVVPDLYDAVVPVEDCESRDGRVTFAKTIASGVNIRLPGEDIRRGQTLFARGHRLSPFDIGILASIGCASVEVYAKPAALLVSTGDELRPLGSALATGEIYDSNRHTATALLEPFCRSLDIRGAVSDVRSTLMEVLARPGCDVIITTGGVSAGDRDFVPGIAESLGWKTVFHKVAIQPGKPLYFASQERRLFFGLPGNPLSVAVTCALFVIPALRRMAGERGPDLTPRNASLDGPGRKSDRTVIWPGSIRKSDTGLVAQWSPKTSSAALTALTGSDGLIIQDPARAAGSPTSVQVLTWQQIFGTHFHL